MSKAKMFSGDLEFLSNFDTTPFYVPALQVTVRSSEHAFNALKTTIQSERGHILAAPTPGGAKKRGRSCSLRSGWNEGVRVAAMATVVSAKFAEPLLQAKLLATGDLKLVETNYWHDQFWGDCICPKHSNEPGKNMLGELLMATRARLRGL